MRFLIAVDQRFPFYFASKILHEFSPKVLFSEL